MANTTSLSEYKRQLAELVSSGTKAKIQAAGQSGQSALNQTASAVSAAIDPGKLDGAKYAEQLAKGIAEIKAVQQKQLEQQLTEQAKAIKAQQKAAAKASATGNKTKKEAAAQEESLPDEGQNLQTGANAAAQNTQSKKKNGKEETKTTAARQEKQENQGFLQRVKAAAAKTLQEGVPAAGENLPEETAKIVSGKENAEKSAKEEKIARTKALNRIQAKAREGSQAARETNAGLLKKEKLNSAEKEEIYNRVNRWLEEDPQNWNAYHALQTAKNKGRVGELLSAGYTNDQLDEANEYLRLYQKMGLDQVIKERIGNTAMGIGKTIVSAPVQAGAAARQTIINAMNAWQNEEYRNAAKLQNAALLQMQELEESGAAMQRDENGNAVGYTDRYKALQQQLAQAQAVLAEKNSEINAPVSKDNIGYKIYQSGQQDLARSDAGLDEGTKFLKGAATSAAENIALAAINPGLVLPGLSAQGAADSMAQSTANEEPAFTALAKGGAKFMAGWAINSVGVEQMLDTMGTSGTRDSMAAQLVKYLKDKSVLSGFAKNNPGFYAVLMGATDNGLQSFAETWADYAIDLAANTAEPKSMEQLLSESLESAASGAAGGAMTAAAGLGVNAGRQVMADRAQAEQNARTAAENARRAQIAQENARDIAAAATQTAMQNGLNQTQEAAANKNTAVNPAENAETQNAAQQGEKAAGYDENGLRNDIADLKNELEQSGEISPRVAKMFLAQGSTEEMTQRKLENRKALAQMLGVEESEIPTTLKAAREYLEWVNPEKLVANSAEAQSAPPAAPAQNGEIANMQSNAENAAEIQRATPTPPTMRAVPTESMSAEMQQMSREIQEGTGRQVEYFESDNDRVRGAYENGKLYLNKNLSSREAAQQTVIHELTHSQEGTETYEKMRRYIANSEILERAAKAATDLNEPPAGMSWAEAWQQKIKEDYEAAGITADPEKEMIAKLCEKYLFVDEDAVRTVCKKDMSLAESILSWVKEMISRVRGATMEAELRHIERLYRKGIAEARGQTEQENKGTKYSYAGEKAETADRGMLEIANRMSNDGIDNEEIRQATGWFKGADGRWRFEIDDSEVKVKDDLSRYGTLKEVIDAPELFKAYPYMEDVFVSFENLNGKNGSYSPTFDSISIDDKFKNDKEGLKRTLVHEIQHAIQKREGFAGGANPQYWQRRIDNGFDSRTEESKNKLRELQQKYDKMQIENPEFVADMEQLEKMLPNKPRGKIDWETLEQIEPDPPEWVKYDAERERMERKYGKEKVFDFYGLSSNLQKARADKGRTAEELYMNTAGEIESRDVQKRRNYTREQRQQVKPDTGNADTVFAEETNANSINPDFAKDVDRWDKNGRQENKVFTLGTTGKALKSIGVQDKSIVMVSDKIIKILKDHRTMDVGMIKQIPEMLENPALVLESSGKSIRTAEEKNSRVVVIGTITDKNNNPVICALDLMPTSAKDIKLGLQDFNKVSSTYAKEHGQKNFLQNSKVLYASGQKNKTEAALSSFGFQLATTELNRLGSIGRISYENGTVNIQGVPFSDVFSAENAKSGMQFSLADSDQQRAMEEAAEKAFSESKVRNEEGRLLPVYHATDESFTRFSKNKLGSFTKDVASDDSMVATAKMGFWFNESDLRERTAQSRSVKAYLNIENPYNTSLYELANLLENSEGNTPGKKAENLRKELQAQGYDGLAVQDDEFGGMSYVTFEANQIKSAEPITYDNSGKEIPLSKRFSKSKDDIRFAVEENEGTVSRKEISRGRFARAAKAKENGDSMLRALFVDEDVAEETMRSMERAREESWAQLRSTKEANRTSGQKVLDRSANGMAWDLKREYHSAADRAELKSQLIDLYADMEGKNTTMEDALGRAREIGMELVQQARPERKANEEMMEAYSDAYQNVTDKVIKLTDSEMQSLLYQWGSLQEFRRKTGNKIRVSTKDGMPIDTLWNELAADYPGKFEADVNDGDRIGKLAEFVNDARPQDVERYQGMEQETAEEIGDRIIDGFMDGKVRTEKERVRKELQKQVRQQVKKGVERLNEDNYAYRQELGKEKKKIEQMAVKLGKKLAHPTKAQHIVADADVQMVVKSIADDALAMVTGRFAGESKLPYVGQKLVALSNGLKSLATTDHRYEGFMTTDSEGNMIPVKFIRDLNELADTMNSIHKENNSVADLGLETARLLRETLQRVEHELETADKLLSDTIGAEHRESVEKTAGDIYSEIDQSRKLGTYNKSLGAKVFRAVGDTAMRYNFWTLNSGRIARMMTNYAPNSAFVEAVDAINKGQRKMMLIKSQASALFADVSNNEFTLGFDKKQRKSKTGLGYTKADYDGFSGRQAQRLDVGFKDARTGETVYITPAMRAELAMHMMNEHNRERVFKGGLMIPDVESLCKGNTEEAGRKSHYVKFDLSEPFAAYAQMEKILGNMSDYETQWVEAAKKYFWDYSGKQYNQATIPLWGYEAANVRNYYPAASDAKSLYQNVAQRNQVEFTVENNGNLKDRVFMATKPIALNEINRTALKSIDTMSRFCGLAMPMRDFEKLYNYGVDFTASKDVESIKSVMDRVWNGKAGKYWEGVLNDINGGNRKDKGDLAKLFGRLRGNYATAVLYGNASTAMKQAASFPTAAAAIGWKPLADGLANYKNDGAKTMEEINKRVATYSMRNSDGNSVYDMGDTSGLIAQTVNKLPGSGWITKADDLTVKVLGSAAKAYVDGHLDGLQKGSAEYWDKVADVYADCIELTQPNSGTMQLSALGRSQNELVRGVTMFSNQRIQNYGLMWDAAADLHAQRVRLSEAMNDKDATEATRKAAQQEVARAKEKFANTMSAMVVQSLMIGLMTAAGKLLWHKMDDYRDDTGKITAKSFAKKIADDALDSMLSNFMGISDLVDVGRYITDKDYSHFDFAVPELDMVNDIVTKTRKFTMALQKAQENDDPEKVDELNENLRSATVALAEQVGQGFGVPLTNLRKNVMGVWNGVMGIAKGDGWIGEYAYTGENLRSMVSGYMDGRYDLAGANEMLEKYCVSKYGKAYGDMEKTERDTAASGMREQIAKDWKEPYVAADDEEREEIAEKLGEIRVGDRKLFTSKVMHGWVDSAENQVQTKATQERAGQLYDDATAELDGQALYEGMEEEAQMDLESSIGEISKTAAKLEAGYLTAEDLGKGDRYLYNTANEDIDKWMNLKAKYAIVMQAAKSGADGSVKTADFLEALEKSGYSTAEQSTLLQAKGGSDKLESASDEVRIGYYRAQAYGDQDGSGSLSQEEFKAYVKKSEMKRSVANEIWNILWKPGKSGSTSPYQ